MALVEAARPVGRAAALHPDRSLCRVFWAESPNIDGLVVEAATLEEMHREAIYAADMLLEMQLTTHRPFRLCLRPQLDMRAPLTTRA